MDERPLLARLGLHAVRLALNSGLTLEAPLSRDMAALLKQMEKYGKEYHEVKFPNGIHEARP